MMAELITGLIIGLSVAAVCWMIGEQKARQERIRQGVYAFNWFWLFTCGILGMLIAIAVVVSINGGGE